MGGGTFGLHNGLGGQNIAHTQWVPPPPPQLHCQSERSAAHGLGWKTWAGYNHVTCILQTYSF